MEWASVTKCKGKVGYVLQPKKPLKIDLMKTELPFEVLARTPALTVIDVDGTQVNLYPTGRMLVRGEGPLPIADKVMECLE
ncbi:hypothetical protein ACFLQ2_03850 [archaeon]